MVESNGTPHGMVETDWIGEKLMLLLAHGIWRDVLNGSFSSASRESFRRFADPPIGRGPREMASTSYRFISKFVTAFSPRNLIAAMSYASAASSSVAARTFKHH